jgi:hypothetical protein
MVIRWMFLESWMNVFFWAIVLVCMLANICVYTSKFVLRAHGYHTSYFFHSPFRDFRLLHQLVQREDLGQRGGIRVLLFTSYVSMATFCISAAIFVWLITHGHPPRLR